MVTAKQVFDMAIHLMDEQNEKTGSTKTVDTDEYRFRTLSILNTAIPYLYTYSSGADPAEAGRPEVPCLIADDYANPDLEQEIPLDDTLSMSCLPYYLAANLLSGENESLSAWFLNRYRETMLDVRDRIPRQWEKITTPYGLY